MNRNWTRRQVNDSWMLIKKAGSYIDVEEVIRDYSVSLETSFPKGGYDRDVLGECSYSKLATSSQDQVVEIEKLVKDLAEVSTSEA